MANIFLSHSSKDKERYVRIVADKLEKEFDEHTIHYDEYTFEEGMKSLEEIQKGLGQTDLFVIFLSKAALESEWVKEELLLSKKALDEKIIKRIYPIVIEPDLKWDDEIIPEWLKEYNLKYVPKTSKAVSLIRKRAIVITWEDNPYIEKLGKIFVGRNQQIQEFETRKYDYDKETVIAYIASGIPQIGRKSLIKHCFAKANIIEEQYRASQIEVNMFDGIENLIINLYDLGYSDEVDMSDFMTISVDEKCKRLAKILDDIALNKEVVLINDSGCIVTYEGIISEWFIRALNMMKHRNRTILGIASKYNIGIPVFDEKVFVIKVPPMSKMECGGLLQKILESKNIFLSQEDYKNYIQMMNGFPEQIKYASHFIFKYGVQRAYDYSAEIQNYDSDIILNLMKPYEESERDMGFVRLLVELDMVTYQTLQGIIGDNDYVKTKVNELYINGIIEFIGFDKEYIKINHAIQEYITRAGYKMPEEYQEKLSRYISDFINKYEYSDLEMPDYLLKLKESIRTAGIIDNKYMLPSQYLKTMVELYEKQKDYSKVIEFADVVLESASYIEERLVFEIRFFLCMALAQKRDKRMLAEVQEISGANHSFLLGFYYRKVGRYEDALEKLNESLKIRKNFSKAKREKVQVLINLERFEEALGTAKENFENDKNNVYHIHAYFLCLIKGNDEDGTRDTLNELLKILSNSITDFGKELYLRCSALFAIYKEHDMDKALALVDKAILQSSIPIYAVQDRFDICERDNNLREMENTIKLLEDLKMRDQYGKERALLRMRLLYAAYTNHEEEVSKIFEEIQAKNLRMNYSIIQKKCENILASFKE